MAPRIFTRYWHQSLYNPGRSGYRSSSTWLLSSLKGTVVRRRCGPFRQPFRPDSGRLYCRLKEVRPDSKSGSGIHRRDVLDRFRPGISSRNSEVYFDFLHPIVLYGGWLQTSTSVSQASGSHGGNFVRYAHLHMHPIQWYLKDQIRLDEPAGSEALSIQQGSIGAGSMLVDGGRQLVSGENFCISTSHCHHRCQCGKM